MPRRLALCFDGTWNTAEDRTNPYRIRNLIASTSTDGWRQLIYYDEGVGSHWHDWFSGGAFGRGLSQNIRDGYTRLARQYEDGDEVFIFGFSRGAYTARSLVGLIRKCGLLQLEPGMGEEALKERVGEAYELYRQKHSSPDVEAAKRFRAQYSREIRVENAYHALAIDEHRDVFAPTLWTTKPDHTAMEQRWFVGAHANVGGGYSRDPLATIALCWIQQKAAGCGLAMTRDVEVRADAHRAPVRDSFTEFMYGAYALSRLRQRHYRPIGDTLNETVDESVLRRHAEDPNYRPPGLERYLGRYA